MSRSLLSVLLAAGAACHVAPSQGVQISPDVAFAGWLAPLRVGPEAQHWHVTIRRAADSTARPLGDKVVAQFVFAPAEAEEILIISTWRPPLTSIDSLVLSPQGLRPVQEFLAFNGYTRRYQYAANHVWGTVQHADSAPRTVDRVFPTPVFAFSEVELLVRAVPFRRGWGVVVPLFSEADEDVEHDTITVEAATRVRVNEREEAAWTVRFADPAIVSTYVLLAASREVFSTDTRQRRSGGLLLFRHAPPPP